jgi:hypothetical protein
MKKQTKKLVLNKETVAMLSQVTGGATGPCTGICTYTCQCTNARGAC